MKKCFPLIGLILLIFMLVSCGEVSYSGEEFNYIKENKGLTLTGTRLTNPTELNIPEVDGGLTVKRIDDLAFDGISNNYNLDNVVKITLPNTIEYIGSSAFANLPSLEEIVLSNSLYMISSKTFLLCKSLKTLTIPEGVRTIESYAFRKCYLLEYVILPSSIKRIDSSAFYISTSTTSGVLNAVYYSGSKDDFSKVKVENYNNDELFSNVYYYSETEISGNYWHYVEGNPTKW